MAAVVAVEAEEETTAGEVRMVEEAMTVDEAVVMKEGLH
jgi:hypothetical protein